MSPSLPLESFFGLQAGQLQGLQACGVQPNTLVYNFFSLFEISLEILLSFGGINIYHNISGCVKLVFCFVVALLLCFVFDH